MIIFTKHAQEKFAVLAKYKFKVSKTQIIRALENPDKTDYSRLPLLIAQKQISKTHVIRVVYKLEKEIKKVITFYPGRIKQYEKR